MRRVRRFFQLVGTEILILGITSVGLGMATGMFVYGNQQLYYIIDPTPLQNFSLYAGGLTGLTICTVAVALYLLTRKLLHHTGFHYRLYLLFSGVTGITIGLAIWGIIRVSAKSYGIPESTIGPAAIIEAISFAIPDGIVAVAIGVVLSLIRGYNS